jgi:type IV pilus assembly protein PilN
MRVNINLATRPYQDVRQFLMQWGAIIVLIAVLTGGLLYYSVSSWRQSRDVNKQIAVLRTEMDRLDHEKLAGLALLNRPENRDTAERSRFLNSVIARKAFSWTRVFEDLESMMPPRLHVSSIAPELDKNNQLQLHMVVAGDSHDRAVELVRRMEESPTFRRPELRSETMVLPGGSTAAGDTIQFDISSQYLPISEAASAAESKPAERAEKTVTGAKTKKDSEQKPAPKAIVQPKVQPKGRR